MDICCCFCCHLHLGVVCQLKGPEPQHVDESGRRKQKRQSIESLQFCEMITRIDETIASRETTSTKWLQTRGESRIFRSYLFIVIAIDFALMLVTLLWTLLGTQYRFWFWTRVGNIIRMTLLISTLFQNVDLYKIKGEGRTDTILRNFSLYPSLGTWVLVGWVDYYLFRWPLFLAHWIYYVYLLSLEGNSAAIVPFLYFWVVDLAYLIESHLSIYFVYRLGVWINILRRLRNEKRPNKV